MILPKLGFILKLTAVLKVILPLFLKGKMLLTLHQVYCVSGSSKNVQLLKAYEIWAA